MNKLFTWMNRRFPLTQFKTEWLDHYRVPKNLNWLYVFGVLLLVLLVNQFLTGFWLVLFYTPTAEEAFSSIQSIMREVNFGWLFRYMHTTGASLLFVMLYLHLFRGLLYGSYQKPRELVWVLGWLLFLLLVLEAALGYLLPWGQLSYWGAQVMISLMESIPVIGHFLALLIRGDYQLSTVTLHRFFAFHVIAVPLIIGFIVYAHIKALRFVGCNNPTGQDCSAENKIAFHPFYTYQDLSAIAGLLCLFFGIVFFFPTFYGYFIEGTNAEKANPLMTPTLISPLWYLAPFYAILRAMPNKFLGIVMMFASISIWFFIPWLDLSIQRALRDKSNLFFWMFWLAVFSFLGLGILGVQELTPIKLWLARWLTMIYFAYFIGMPLFSRMRKS